MIFCLDGPSGFEDYICEKSVSAFGKKQEMKRLPEVQTQTMSLRTKTSARESKPDELHNHLQLGFLH